MRDNKEWTSPNRCTIPLHRCMVVGNKYTKLGSGVAPGTYAAPMQVKLVWFRPYIKTLLAIDGLDRLFLTEEPNWKHRKMLWTQNTLINCIDVSIIDPKTGRIMRHCNEWQFLLHLYGSKVVG